MSGQPDQPKRGRLAPRLVALAPRGRILAATVAAVAVLSGAGCAAAGSDGGHRPAGASATDGASAAAGAGAGRQTSARPAATGPAQDRLGPVILVPGYGGGTGALGPLAASIRAGGRSAIVLPLPGSGAGSLRTDASRLNAAVNRALRRGAPSVDVVGYSAGGVVALIWARLDDGAAKARRVITLSAPFHGTSLAAAAENLLPQDCPAACRQLVPGSKLLTSLNVANPDGLPRWLSLWTTDDQVVVPPISASLPGAIDVPVQSVCPAVTVGHTQLPANPVVMAMVLAALGRSPLRAPSSRACSAR